MTDAQYEARGYRVFEWINRNIKGLSIVLVITAVVLGVVGPMVASEDQPSFNSGGEIYDTDDLVVDRFDADSPIRAASFFVETDDVTATPDTRVHDVLTADALREFKANADAVRAEYSSGDDPALVRTFDNDLGVEIDGIYSIADAVDILERTSSADALRCAFGGLLCSPLERVLRHAVELADRAPGLLQLPAPEQDRM